jgi:hypothetical protein
MGLGESNTRIIRLGFHWEYSTRLSALRKDIRALLLYHAPRLQLAIMQTKS